MLVYVFKRLLLGLMVMFAISMVVFALTNAAADPAQAIAGEGATAADIESIRKSYGFDRPVIVRYGSPRPYTAISAPPIARSGRCATSSSNACR